MTSMQQGVAYQRLPEADVAPGTEASAFSASLSPDGQTLTGRYGRVLSFDNDTAVQTLWDRYGLTDKEWSELKEYFADGPETEHSHFMRTFLHAHRHEHAPAYATDTNPPRISLARINGQTVQQPWFKAFAECFLSNIRVTVTTKLPHYGSPQLFFSRSTHRKVTINGLTAVLLVLRLRESEEGCLKVFGIAPRAIARDIRTNGLGAFLGTFTVQLLVNAIVRHIDKRRVYTTSYDELRASQDLLVAYLGRDDKYEVHSPLNLKVKDLFATISTEPPPPNTSPRVPFRTLNVYLLGLRPGIAYGSLVGVLNDIKSGAARTTTLIDEAIDVLGSLAANIASIGVSVLPFGGTGAAVVNGFAQVGTMALKAVASSSRKEQQAILDIITEVVDKFNLEVLSNADIGRIGGFGPPQGDEGTRDPREHRVTAELATNFKTIAANVFLIVTRQEGITLVNKVITAPSAAPISRIAGQSQDIPEPEGPPALPPDFLKHPSSMLAACTETSCLYYLTSDAVNSQETVRA